MNHTERPCAAAGLGNTTPKGDKTMVPIHMMFGHPSRRAYLDHISARTERPCAAAGLTSYRYGSIMIGASSTQDALNEADRSLTQGAATVDRLEIWNALTGLYEKVTP